VGNVFLKLAAVPLPRLFGFFNHQLVGFFTDLDSEILSEDVL